MDPSGFITAKRPAIRPSLVSNPYLHRGRRDGLRHHAHRLGRRPDQEWFDHPGQRGIDFRWERRQRGLTIKTRTNLPGRNRLGQNGDFSQSAVETVILVAIEIATDRERLVAGIPHRSGLIQTLRHELAILVEPHRGSVVGSDEMVPLSDRVGNGRPEIGDSTIGIVEPLACDPEVGRFIAVSKHHARLRLSVVLNRTDDSTPLGGHVDRNPGFQRD